MTMSSTPSQGCPASESTVSSQPPAAHTPSDYEQMFDWAPVSLWLEDYSGLKRLFTQWRSEGIDNLASHLKADPQRLEQCMREYRVLRVNQYTLDLFEARDQAELQSRLSEVLRDDIKDTITDELCQLWSGRMGFDTQTFNYTLSGRRLEVRIRARILQGHEDTWDRVLLTLEDVTREEHDRKLLAERERYASSLFELSPVSLWVEDFTAIKALIDEVRACGIEDFSTFVQVHPDFVGRCVQEIRVIDINQHTLHMLGAPSKEAVIKQLGEVFRDEMHESFKAQLIDLWNGKTFQQREVVNYSLNGTKLHIHMQFAVMPGHEADWSRVLVSLVDITARKKAEAYLEYLGKHDVLTKLRNRAFFSDEVNRLSRKGPWPVSVLVIDLNGLKEVNDDEGHAGGDDMLRRAGEVLGKAVDAPACACRIGGDEFIVLMPGSQPGDALVMQERITKVLELNNQFYPGKPLSFAIGQGTCQAGESLDQTIQQADRAMYESKAAHYKAQTKDRRAR